MTFSEWRNTKAFSIMNNNLDITIFVQSSVMSEQEKKDYPKHETTGGYLKTITLKEAWKNMWGNLTQDAKSAFTSLPNFNAEKFLEITGVDVNE
jgi:hypothetical protein